MGRKLYCRIIDTSGKLMLGWFVVCTVRYFYGGRFSEQLNYIRPMFRDDDYFWLAYTLLQIPVAAAGVFALIALLLKGSLWGLALGLVYLVMGYHWNPLWYILPRDMQVGPGGEATPLLHAINWGYALFTCALLPAFYFCRRPVRDNKPKGAADDQKNKR